MEYAIHIGRLTNKEKINDINKYDRIYFGDDFCEYMQPDEKEIEDIISLADNTKKSLTLVTSPMGQTSLKKLVKLIDKYQFVLHQFNFELVFNDYGVYHILSSDSSIDLVCGRVLMRFKRDPRQYVISQHLDSSFYETNFSGEHIQALFLKNKIKRIDIDWNPNIKIESKNFNYSVVTPWTYLTTTRLCRFNDVNLYDEQNRLRVSNSCSKICKNSKVIIKNDCIPKELLVVGNTQFYYADRPPSNSDENFYNRIVEQRMDDYE